MADAQAPAASLSAIRQQYPQYNDMTDAALADSLYSAHYGDMPREQFNAAIGYKPDSALASAGKFLATAAAHAGGALTDAVTHGPQAAIRNMLFPDAAKIESEWGNPTNTGVQSANEDLKATGTEYQPTTAPGRIGLAATTGALAGGGAGLPAAGLSALSAGAGQTAAEAGASSPWQLAASALPLAIAPIVAGVKGVTASPESRATSLIGKAVKSDAAAGGPDLLRVTSDLANANGSPLALADVGGESLKGAAENVATLPGQSRQISTDFLNQRDMGAGPRLIQQTVNGLSSGKSAFQTAQELQQARSEAAAPLYEQAFKENQNVSSPALDRILKTPAGQQALAAARIKMQNDQTLMGVPDKELTAQARETGQNTARGMASGLKLRTWDYVKRALDDQIGSAFRAGNNDDARILIGQKNSLLNELDKADVTAQAGPNSTKPEGGLYAQARAAYSGPTQSLGAVEEGAQVFNKSPELIAQDISKLSPGDQDFYRIGAADALRRRISQTSSGGNEALRIVGNDYVKQQLRPLFNSDGAYNQFIQAAQNESNMFRTRQQMIGNSPTARRLANAGEGSSIPGAVMQAGAALLAHEPVAGLPALGRLGKTLYQKALGPGPETNAALARMMFSSDPASNAQTLNAVRAYLNGNRSQAPLYSPLLTPGLLNGQQFTRLLGP